MASVLREFVRRFRAARGLGGALDAAIEEAFRGRVCDLLTRRMFADNCPKMRRELLGRALGVNRGTRHRWLSESPGYDNLFRGLLARRTLFAGRNGVHENDVIAQATAAAMAAIRERIDGGKHEPPPVATIRRLERWARRTQAPTDGELDAEDRTAMQEWLIPWLVFQDATDFLWRLPNEP